MRHRAVFAVLSISAWAGCALFVWAAWRCVQTAKQAAELWPYLLSEAEPFAQSAMYTLEDQQFRWYTNGGVFAIFALLCLAAGLWRGRLGRKGRLQ